MGFKGIKWNLMGFKWNDLMGIKMEFNGNLMGFSWDFNRIYWDLVGF